MTAPLKCAIDEHYSVAAKVDRRLPKPGKSGSVLIEVQHGDSVIATKSLPWPAGEEPPCELKYDDKKNELQIRNRTTLATMPVRLRVLRSLSELHTSNSTGPRFIKSLFVQVKQEECSFGKLIAAIRAAITSESDSKWKKLKKLLKDSALDQGRLSSVLSHQEQTDLIRLLRNHATDDDITDVLKALCDAEVFGYRLVDELFRLADEISANEVISTILESPTVVLPPRTLVRAFKRIANMKAKKAKPELLQVLSSRPFNDRTTAIAASDVLSSEEAAVLVEWLTQLYEDTANFEHHEKILSMLSLLLDSHSSQFLNDTATHERLLQTASLIGAMAALTGSFAELEMAHAARKNMPKEVPVERPRYSLTPVTLVKRVWNEALDEAEKPLRDHLKARCGFTVFQKKEDAPAASSKEHEKNKHKHWVGRNGEMGGKKWTPFNTRSRGRGGKF